MQSSLPTQIRGGLAGVASDLDRRAREWRTHVWVTRQQLSQLEAAELGYSRSLEHLVRLIPTMQAHDQDMFAAMEAAKDGNVSEDLGDKFSTAVSLAQELETATSSVASQLEWVRATWNIYAESMLLGEKMSEELERR